jgi:AAA domain
VAEIWSQWDRARTPLPGFAAAAAALPAPESIPPREWLYGTRLVRRFVSVLAAPGGVGKSALALGQAVALACGKPLLGERVHHSTPAWVLNLEDPLDEMNRRLAALLRLHRLDDAAVAGRLFLHSGRSRRVCMAQLGPDGGIVHPDREAVVAAATAAGIGLIVVDPFVKSHLLDENSNPHMDAAATAWAEVAERTGAAVLLVHHVRKTGANGGNSALDVEASRGAKALTDAARSASMLAAMSPEEAERLSVPPGERWRYVRLDDAKANMAPRAEAALWYRLEGVPLGNVSALYPYGDTVAALTPWRPPSPFVELDPAACNRALDAIAAGCGEGQLFGANRGGGYGQGERWGGHCLMAQGASDAAAGRILALWLRTGLLQEVTYRDPVRRKPQRGLRVVDAKRPTGGA